MDTASARVAQLDDVLRGLPHQYRNKARLRRDVADLLQSCRTLQPQIKSFSANGASSTLFYLYGVLPINYSGNTYNIPVTIYFDPPYPDRPPRCFVTPTEGMALKNNHPHVDQGGMVYAPCLTSWSSHNSHLSELIAVLTSLFAQNPPVYSTASSSRPTPSRPAASPGQHAVQGAFEAIGSIFSGGSSQANRPASHPAAVPVNAVPVTAVPVARPYAQQQQPVATVVATPVVRSAHAEREALTNEVTSLLRDRWPCVVEPLTKELEEQVARKSDLQNASASLEREAAKLTEAVVKAQGQEKDLRDMEAELRASVEAEANREELDTDQIINSLDADRRQVLDILAEELALEELLTALDELLAAKKITSDDFMREVRDVSRRQFMCKMMRQKAAKAVAGACGQSADQVTSAAPGRTGAALVTA
eukprot:TRINITY_DN46586_c0_g1_i1.p1 TRINITY_DN46586_c0_g1~~TRINITY_DN46586_c0_g1_i1.p1  ORF type:complete len:430 (+),score=89.78 TRINITY_DN46586_c0_g1_i1:30-1292(+)